MEKWSGEGMRVFSGGKGWALKSHHFSYDHRILGFSGELIPHRQPDFRHKRAHSICDSMLILSSFPFYFPFYLPTALKSIAFDDQLDRREEEC